MEQWRVITSFPNYDVSNTGRIRRNCPGPGTFAGREKTITVVKYRCGYRQARVKLWHGKRWKQCKVAQLVLLAFCPEQRLNRMAMHLDDNPLNNHYTNLKWGSNGQNQRHRFRKRTLLCS